MNTKSKHILKPYLFVEYVVTEKEKLSFNNCNEIGMMLILYAFILEPRINIYLYFKIEKISNYANGEYLNINKLNY